ncbi:MAG: HEPN domain-containing protein [Deltaproteobacteria bacterium]|nr:HEPN domain-containing protein [Deltaproteobacteria bacterium]
MKNNEFVRDWLKRARSNLERARVGKIKDEILYEDLCFDCQQSAEKAIKALLISIDKEFPPTHSIARLLEIVSETKTEIPEEIQKAIDLTDYAVKTRYPGESEPVTKEEYEEALTIAETIYNWVSSIIKADRS